MNDEEKRARLKEAASARLARFALPALEQMSTADVAALVEELQIHQIELELQQDELQRVNASLVASREWYYAMFEAAATPLIIVKPGPVIADVNLVAAELLGWDRRALAGQPLVKYFAAERRSALSEVIRHVSEGTRARVEINAPLVRRGGDRRFVELRCARVEAPGAEAVLIGIVDVHEREQQRRASEAALRKAKRVDELKTQFLANISHELRAPLSSVIGYLDVVLEGREPEKTPEMLAIARKAASHVLSTVEDLLDLARIEADHMTLVREPVAIAELCAEMLAMFANRARDAGVELRHHVDAELPRWVLGDGHRIRQIIINLVTNALKFTERGHVELRVAYRERNAVFVVADTGIGISEERLSRIFDPFEQVDASDARRFGGAGLGLSLCRRLVEQMDGAILVRSELGEGSRFTVQIPLLEISEEEAARLRVNATSEPRAWAAERKPHVLVVDDDENLTRLFSMCLKVSGYSVKMAMSGEEALRALAEERFDLVVLDMQMPIMDGYQVAARIRERHALAALPIVAVSASAMRHEQVRSLAAGCNGFISKPVEIRTFASEVGKFLPARPSSASE